MVIGVLFCLAVGAGGWNYMRNTAAEAGVFRPYQANSRTDLEALMTAYEAEIEALQQRYTTASHNRATAANRHVLEARVREFERVQRTGRATRELGGQLAEKQATLKRIQTEHALRGSDDSEIAVILRRVFVYHP
jgi:hypothetical protein